MDQTKRQFQIFPMAGKQDFTVYEDDGISRKYLKGAYAETKVTSNLQEGQLEVNVAPLSGNYTGLKSERTTEFAIRTSGNPSSVIATVGSQQVALKAVTNQKDYDAGENVYFVNSEYHTNQYLEKLTDKKAIDQTFLQVKLAKTNAATNGIKLTVSGIDAKDDPSTDDLPVNDELAIPSTIKQDEKTTTDTAVGINWSL
ncbi:DUF5110 domain-containing protein [Lacticaseibacillus paracasei]|nr:DUF5110 domain-containing protein [Lacticaseibacillus paracasei]MDE3305578.1 DUF5110 domain-containing protein [Lacticaseibacillus paracasei]